MNKKIEDYLHMYLGCEVYNPAYPMWDFELEAVSIVVGGKRAKLNVIIENEEGPYPDDGWYIPDKLQLALRPLSSMTDDEAQECLAFVFLVPPHNAWMDVEALQQFLSNNVAFTIGVSEEEQGDIPMNMFELTPQTMFNLTEWLLSRYFDLFGLIDAGLAIDKTSTK